MYVFVDKKNIVVFQSICSGSAIDQKRRLENTKIAYSILYGIALFFFQNVLVQNLPKYKYISVAIKEALNKLSQKVIMNVNIDIKTVIQISMDCPKVNLIFYKDLKEEFEKNENFPVILLFVVCTLCMGLSKQPFKEQNGKFFIFSAPYTIF